MSRREGIVERARKQINTASLTTRIFLLAVLSIVIVGVIPQLPFIDGDFLLELLNILVNTPVLAALVLLYVFRKFRPEIGRLIDRVKQVGGNKFFPPMYFGPIPDLKDDGRGGDDAQGLYVLGNNIYFAGLTLLDIHNDRRIWEYSRKQLHDALLTASRKARQYGFDNDAAVIDDIVHVVQESDTRPYPHQMVDLISRLKDVADNLPDKIKARFTLSRTDQVE